MHAPRRTRAPCAGLTSALQSARPPRTILSACGLASPPSCSRSLTHAWDRTVICVRRARAAADAARLSFRAAPERSRAEVASRRGPRLPPRARNRESEAIPVRFSARTAPIAGPPSLQRHYARVGPATKSRESALRERRRPGSCGIGTVARQPKGAEHSRAAQQLIGGWGVGTDRHSPSCGRAMRFEMDSPGSAVSGQLRAGSSPRALL